MGDIYIFQKKKIHRTVGAYTSSCVGRDCKIEESNRPCINLWDSHNFYVSFSSPNFFCMNIQI